MVTRNKYDYERDFQKKVIADLMQLQKCWLVKVSQRAKRGTPDIIACINGSFFAFELKRGKKEADAAEPLQVWNVTKIRESGGKAWIIYPDMWPRLYLELITWSSYLSA